MEFVKINNSLFIFLNNKLHSYGGNLTFEFKYTNSEGAEDLNFQNLELRLSV